MTKLCNSSVGRIRAHPLWRGRQLYTTNTFKNDAAFLHSVYTMFKSAALQHSAVPGLVLNFAIQPIPPEMTSKSAATGGNSIGLDPSNGALVLCLFSATWDNASDDGPIMNTIKSLNSKVVDAAKSRGLFNEWIYLNYADAVQDPIGGYGAANGARLRAVSKKYDPDQVFQRNVPGGFKLFT